LCDEGTRAWLLHIVRNKCASWPKTRTVSNQAQAPSAGKTRKEQIKAALSGLPVLYREVLVLRELEDLSYSDIARIVEVPVETVMSRLARARVSMQAVLHHVSVAKTGLPRAQVHRGIGRQPNRKW
jgi:RNA polymerase sigma-70 factor (ECF subfamily)